MNDLQTASGLLTIHATSNNANINLHTVVPKQTIHLKNVRIEMTSASVALSEKMVYVDLPFLSGDQLIDHRDNLFNLPLPLDNAIVTHFQTDIPLHLMKEIPERFQMIVRNEAGNLISNLVSITLQFAYNLNRT